MLALINSDEAVMVVHGGGVYGDKEATIKRWCEQYHQLPVVRRFLVLENCENVSLLKIVLGYQKK